jgi:hypothetical protein
MKIVHAGKNCSFIELNTGVVAVTEERTIESLPYFTSGNYAPIRIGDYNIIPYGDSNNMPTELREILDANNITPEVLNKQEQQLLGQGPALYEVRFENGKKTKYWVTDPEIESWLKSWDWEDYLLKANIEFRHVNGHFTRFFRNRAARIGGPGMITHLEHVSVSNARLEWPDTAGKINNIITGEFERTWDQGLKKYPVYDWRNPFQHPVAMSYSNLYAFAMDNDYSRPQWYGIINWIKLGSDIPKLLKNFNDNSAAIKYHIESPSLYWEIKRDTLKKNCTLTGVEYKESMLEDLKDDIYKSIGEALVGIEKAGKFISTETVFDDMSREYVGWKITPLDQKVKDFIEAQIEIAKRSDFAITAGLGLHPALSNLSADGNLPSGSEQLYAFKLYLSTGVDIPESIVCRAINYAILANFPGKSLKIGFYHDVVTTEETTSPSNRLKNQK